MPLQGKSVLTPDAKPRSEEGVAHVRQCRKPFNALPLECTSREHVESIENWLRDTLNDIWKEFAATPSKSWWSS